MSNKAGHFLQDAILCRAGVKPQQRLHKPVSRSITTVLATCHRNVVYPPLQYMKVLFRPLQYLNVLFLASPDAQEVM